MTTSSRVVTRSSPHVADTRERRVPVTRTSLLAPEFRRLWFARCVRRIRVTRRRSFAFEIVAQREAHVILDDEIVLMLVVARAVR